MPDLRQTIESYFNDRFGVDPSFWEPYRFKEKSGSYWVLADTIEPDNDVIAQGLRLLRERRVRMKPTSHGLRFIGPALEENIIELDRDELSSLVFEREELAGYNAITEGYVALAFDGFVLGCGRKRRTGIETQISKGRASELEAMLGDDPIYQD
ncbi:MAG: hypothetical protein MUP66_04130 [Candidatus Nanohaloarchaeota archaeon QJJ-5]|nr:hypothetical protein [Candidatus Nanohaloarchaeota archaeon QJJ-5]